MDLLVLGNDNIDPVFQRPELLGDALVAESAHHHYVLLLPVEVASRVLEVLVLRWQLPGNSTKMAQTVVT